METALDFELPAIVCIPARRERRMLPALLQSLTQLQVGARRTAFCFYLDGRDDAGEALLRDAAATLPGRVHVMIGEDHPEPNAGRARRAAMTFGLTLTASENALLFTTDADSQPAPDWISAGAAALRVADVVAGLILRQDGTRDRDQTRIERYYDRLHAYRRRIDPVPWEADATHHFGGGANMAIRAGVYQAIGGFRPLPSAEDATLLDDAARAGFRVRRDAAMIVHTSSRRDGRARGGLAGALRSLDGGEVQRVAHPDGAAWQALAQAMARRSYAGIEDAAVRATLGAFIGLSGDHVLGVSRDCPTAEAFAMRVVPAPPMAGHLVALDEAEAALAALEDGWCEVAA